jgi:amino acid transporter
MKHVEPAAAAIPQKRTPHRYKLSNVSSRRIKDGSGSRGNLRAVPVRTEFERREQDAGQAGSQPALAPAQPSSGPRKLGLLSLVAATFFIVSGGPYGLEEIVGGHGYLHTLALLVVVPLVWSLPIALLVGEMSSTLPQEGGYYAWVRRALGPFWGMQVAWVALAMSLFDMAIYPTLMVTYLGRVFPMLRDTSFGAPGWLAGVVMIGLCTLWNLRGSCSVGRGGVLLGALLLLPFVGMIGGALLQLRHVELGSVLPLLTAPPPGGTSSSLWVTGVLLCMWNYMGWDNASTVAADVERPQRTYPRAMALTVVLVAVVYLVPVLAAVLSGMPASAWGAGSWVDVGNRLGGPLLGTAMAVGGALCALGMFNMLVMSYSRLPLAMTQDRLLPRSLGVRSPRTGAPTRIIVISAVLYAACMHLGFRKLVEIDVILYGAAIMMQFAAIIVLRVREPKLVRPFRIPGGMAGLILMAAMPIGLLGIALWAGRHEPGLWGLSSLQLGALITLGGPLLFGLRAGVKWLLRSLGRHSAPVQVVVVDHEAETAEHAALSIS